MPALTPAARPVLLTVATFVALLAHVNVTPLIVLPLLSFAVALNCRVPPTAIEDDDGETAMVTTFVGVVPEEPQPTDNASTAKQATRQRLFTRPPF